MLVFPGVTAGAEFTFSTADYDDKPLFPLAATSEMFFPDRVYKLTHCQDNDEFTLGAFAQRAQPVAYEDIPQILALCLKSIAQFGLPIDVHQIIRPPSPSKHGPQFWTLGIRAICKPKSEVKS